MRPILQLAMGNYILFKGNKRIRLEGGVIVQKHKSADVFPIILPIL